MPHREEGNAVDYSDISSPQIVEKMFPQTPAEEEKIKGKINSRKYAEFLHNFRPDVVHKLLFASM